MLTITFEHPCNLQISSSLIQLPTELRLKILRLLLVQGHAIETWRCYYVDNCRCTSCRDKFVRWGPGHPSMTPSGSDVKSIHSDIKKTQWLSLSSQILQCCQALYHDGEAILYQENTIVIRASRWTGSDSNHAYLTVLDSYIGIPEWPLHASQASLGEGSYQWSRLDLWAQHEPTLKPLSSATCKTLLRFSNILVEVYVDEDNMSLFSLTYLLQDYMATKNVTVALWPGDTNDPEWYWVLKCFEVWRCKSIKFLDLTQDALLLVDPIKDPKTEATQQIITGTTPVVDLLHIAADVHNALCQVDNYFRGVGLMNYPPQFPQVDEIWYSIIEQDAQRFKKCAKVVLAAALNALYANTQRNLSRLDEGIDHVNCPPEAEERLAEAKQKVTEKAASARNYILGVFQDLNED